MIEDFMTVIRREAGMPDIKVTDKRKVDKGKLDKSQLVNKEPANCHPRQQGTPPDKIIFRNRQRIGDILCMTCAIRDFKQAFPHVKVNVETTASHIWDHNPYLDRDLRGDEYILDIGPGTATNQSNDRHIHLAEAFSIDIENKLGLRFKQGPVRPDLWMTEEEYNAPPLIEGPYWVVVIGGEPGWPAKMWPADRFQSVVDSFGHFQFVQLGTQKDTQHYPKLRNVIDYVGKTEDPETGIRDLFNVFLHAQGALGLVSFQMHLAAGFCIPCVVVAGAREPAWFTHYFGHQYLETNGCVPCGRDTACWACSLDRCGQLRDGKIPKCVDLIEPDDVSAAISKYYEGGRLIPGEKTQAHSFVNIVKGSSLNQKSLVIPNKSLPAPNGPEKYGMEWGGSNITEKDWLFLKRIIQERKVKSVLHFDNGSGLGSLLLFEEGLDVTVYETNLDDIERLTNLSGGKMKVRHWDGENIKNKLGPVDLSIVDGPAGGKNREHSVRIASGASKSVCVHDSHREWETKWQDKYLQGQCYLNRKGGSRYAFWTKSKPKKVKNTKGLVRLVSTARGYGGAQRSTNLIMKMLCDRKYAVEFCPFHGEFSTGQGICSEYSDNMDRRVEVVDWSMLAQPCDVLLIYADDYVWNFNKPEVIRIFSELGGDRRIMFLNYRRGGVGEIDWTKHFDLYGGLNWAQMGDLQKVHPEAKTFSLPPCTDLTEFFKVKPSFKNPLRLIRHNSQGDVKFAKDFMSEITKIYLKRRDTEFHMMPGPSFVGSSSDPIILCG
jgi:ADP-heptose:LPS heptosyltransferase